MIIVWAFFKKEFLFLKKEKSAIVRLPTNSIWLTFYVYKSLDEIFWNEMQIYLIFSSSHQPIPAVSNKHEFI